jgi:hypothetical protein
MFNLSEDSAETRFEHSLYRQTVGDETPLNLFKADKIDIHLLSHISLVLKLLSYAAAKAYFGTTFKGRLSDCLVVFVTIPAVLLGFIFTVWWKGNPSAW